MKRCSLSALTRRISTLERMTTRIPREPGLANTHATLETKAYAESLLRDFVDCMTRACDHGRGVCVAASVSTRMARVLDRVRPLYTNKTEKAALTRYDAFTKRVRAFGSTAARAVT
jgi:hypothetical protein